MFHLQSPYGSVEDRTSVAYLGLVRAAREFVPGQKTYAGKLKPFAEFASRIINEELTSYVLSEERPLHDASSHATSIETLYFEGAADEEADPVDDHPSMLRAEEVISEQRPQPASLKAMESQLGRALDQALKALPERDAAIVRLRLGFDREHGEYTFSEIGEIFGIVPGWASQIFRKSIKKLNRWQRTQLADFLYVKDDGEGPQPMRSGDVVKTVQAAGQSTVRLMVEVQDDL